jgi:transcriptional antiterminator NusG
MKRWYVVQVFTGFEDLVKTDLEKRIIEENLQDFFGEILVPT